MFDNYDLMKKLFKENKKKLIAKVDKNTFDDEQSANKESVMPVNTQKIEQENIPEIQKEIKEDDVKKENMTSENENSTDNAPDIQNLEDNNIYRTKIEHKKICTTCPNCGTANKTDSIFCESCGYKLKEIISPKIYKKTEQIYDKIWCPNCGHEIDNENKFCSFCGHKLKSKSGQKSINSLKIILIALISIFIIGCISAGYSYYQYIQRCKESYRTTMIFSDTKVDINATYNDVYKLINIDLTVDEVIEPWQIEEMGESSAYVIIKCKTHDGLNQEFGFYDIHLKAGEKLKGRCTMENATLKDFIMVKKVLGNCSCSTEINYPKILAMNSKERSTLKREYYKRKEIQRMINDPIFYWCHF